MLGSSASVSDTNTTLNTAVAEVLKQFADELEGAENFEASLHDLIKKVITAHKRIIFNGNGYDDKWIAEAEKRGLSNLATTPDAMPAFISEKSIALFTSHKVYTEREIRSRYEIFLESYCKIIHIEAKTMLDMAMKEILPAVSEYSQVLANTILSKKAVNKKIDCSYEEEMLERVSWLVGESYRNANALKASLDKMKEIVDITERSFFCKDETLFIMKLLRSTVDSLENIVSADYWPIPTYGDLLFGV
jgi:glutamine synthetase